MSQFLQHLQEARKAIMDAYQNCPRCLPAARESCPVCDLAFSIEGTVQALEELARNLPTPRHQQEPSNN